MFKYNDKRLKPIKYYKYAPFVLVKSAERYLVKPNTRVWVDTGLIIDKDDEFVKNNINKSLIMLNLYDYYGVLGLTQPSLNIYSLNYNKTFKILVNNTTNKDIFIKQFDFIAQVFIIPTQNFKELRDEKRNYTR